MEIIVLEPFTTVAKLDDSWPFNFQIHLFVILLLLDVWKTNWSLRRFLEKTVTFHSKEMISTQLSAGLNMQHGLSI